MNLEILLIIFVIAIANLITRFFVYFFTPKNIPSFINKLSDTLPHTIIAILVVYCLKDTNINAPFYGLKEIAGILVVAILHLSIKIPVISILGGVIVYMMLVQRL